MNIKIKMIIEREKSIKKQNELSSKIGKTCLKSEGSRQYKSHISCNVSSLIKKEDRKKCLKRFLFKYLQ